MTSIACASRHPSSWPDASMSEGLYNGVGIGMIAKGITLTKINGELQPIHSSAPAEHASHPLALAGEIALAQIDQPPSPNLARIA